MPGNTGSQGLPGPTRENGAKLQGPKLRLPGRQSDQKLSLGDQNFIAGR